MRVMGSKWKPLILLYIKEKTPRFGELRRCIPEITQKMLTAQLREHEADDAIHRKVYQQVPPKVEYLLSEYGESLQSVLKAMCDWGKKHRVDGKTNKKQKKVLGGIKASRVVKVGARDTYVSFC